eukprot:9501670-Pyramimonas_sp.AAC.1
MPRVDGYSPSQRALGQEPCLPGDMLQDAVDVVSVSGRLCDGAFARAREMRQLAMRGLLRARGDQGWRRAVAGPEPSRAPFSAWGQ